MHVNYRASVIIPVYNAESTLRRCVESLVLGQERNIEVILCEDCSTDKSWALCLELSKEFPNVKCIQNENNRGVSYTRNQGLAVAQGEYILFVDSDDWVSQRYAQELLRLARENIDALPICALHFIDKVNSVNRDYTWNRNHGSEIIIEPNSFFELCASFLLQQLWNKCFCREMIEQYHIRFDETQSMGEDFQFVLDYMEATRCKKCIVINEPLYYYVRWNNSSLMSKFGFIQCQQEFDRMAQLSRIAGPASASHRDSMIIQHKQNYIYHIVRNPNYNKQEKLNAIEQIMADHKAINHYRTQKLLQAKERAFVMITSAKKLYPKLRNRMHSRTIQKKTLQIKNLVHATDFTIISQNCIGGVLYHDLGMEFLTPTVNAFIPQPDFVRFVLNLEYYLTQDLEMHWEEEYPVGQICDIRIHFMHYTTCKEAKDCWNRRKARIKWDKILILSTDRDGFDDAVYQQWKDIPYPKILFTVHKKYYEPTDSIHINVPVPAECVGDLIPNREFYAQNLVINKLNNL